MRPTTALCFPGADDSTAPVWGDGLLGGSAAVPAVLAFFAKMYYDSRMIDWQPIETAPRDGTLILLGCESDPFVDTHMFFVDLGWSYQDGFWSVSEEDIHFPSHWAPLTSPVQGAAVTFYNSGRLCLSPGGDDLGGYKINPL